MTTGLQQAAVAYAVEQIHAIADRIREAWSWLADLAEPGPAAPAPSQAESDEKAERLEAAAHEARAYREHNLRHGMSALPPSPAPVRLGVLDAQAAVDRIVVAAVLALAETGGPGTRARADAAAAAGVPAMLDWIVGVEVGLGATGRDGVWLKLRGAISRVRDAQLAADVERILARADRTARAAAGDVDEPGEQVIDPASARPARCPACGRRSLQRQSTGLVRCVSESCRCTGDAEPGRAECGCLRDEKREGVAHVWTRASEPELWAAIDRNRPSLSRRGVGRGAHGHGGWQSRGMAGQQ